MAIDYKKMYRELVAEKFAPKIEISFVEDSGKRQTLVYEKALWDIGGERMSLRYGENPGQPAAMYRLVNGNLVLGEVESIAPKKHLISDVELIQSGKHPGKINLTDVDAALNILRYLTDKPTVVINKHNNPCGVARASSLDEAFHKAFMADRIAAFGGAVALNRTVGVATAKLLNEQYFEVVVAPDFEGDALEILKKRKNLRIMRIKNMKRLEDWAYERFVEFKSLIDGGFIIQWSFVSRVKSADDFEPAVTTYQGKEYKIKRMPTEREKNDLLFGWLVETGVTSNSILYAKDEVTVAISTGEQDRVGSAQIARNKAYRNLADRLSFERSNLPLYILEEEKPNEAKKIWDEVNDAKGGLKGAVMISDAFFPFKDGVEVGIKEKITAVAQPGGSERDWEVIEACNKANVAMVFTGQRCFKH